MADKKYPDFAPGTPQPTDITLFSDPVTGELKRTLVTPFLGLQPVFFTIIRDPEATPEFSFSVQNSPSWQSFIVEPINTYGFTIQELTKQTGFLTYFNVMPLINLAHSDGKCYWFTNWEGNYVEFITWQVPNGPYDGFFKYEIIFFYPILDPTL